MESSARDPHPGSRPGRSRGGRRAWADRGRRVGARATFRLAAFAVALAGALVSVACEPADPLAEVRALHAAGRYEDSLAPLRELIDERPDDPEVLYLYGVALGGAGFRTQAVWPLRRAMEDEAWATPAAVQLANVAISTACVSRWYASSTCWR